MPSGVGADSCSWMGGLGMTDCPDNVKQSDLFQYAKKLHVGFQ